MPKTCANIQGIIKTVFQYRHIYFEVEIQPLHLSYNRMHVKCFILNVLRINTYILFNVLKSS